MDRASGFGPEGCGFKSYRKCHLYEGNKVMKFHCSDFFDFKGNPKPWVDYGLNEEESMKKYFFDIIKIYDADTCGDEEYDFVFDSGNAYRLEYEWYIEFDPEWRLVDNFYIEPIDLEEARCMKKYRNILGKPGNSQLFKYAV
jgi:hypothetical protein